MFCILLYVAAALQSAHFGTLSGASYRPYPQIEYLVLLTIFYSLFGDERNAPLASLWCGIVYDLITGTPPGTHAIPLGLVGYGIVNIRLSVFREQFISQLVLSLLAIIGFGVLCAALSWLSYKIAGSANVTAPLFWQTVGIFSASGIYSCLLAPGIFWLLLRMRPLLGFSQHSRR